MNDNLNEDWLKTRTWDVRLPGGQLAQTLADLRWLFPGVPDAQFRSWPSLRAAPAGLRRELDLPDAV